MASTIQPAGALVVMGKKRACHYCVGSSLWCSPALTAKEKWKDKQSSVTDPDRQTQVNGVREAGPHPLFPSALEDLLLR